MDRDFDYFFSEFCDFGCDFRAEFKTHAIESDLVQKYFFKHFIAGRFIGNFGAIEKIGDDSDQHSAQIEERPGISVVYLFKAPRTIDNIRIAVFCCLKHNLVVIRIIFEIGVLDNDIVAGRVLEAGSQSKSFAVISILIDHFVSVFNGFQFVSGSICRTVIYDYYLFFCFSKIGLFNFLDDFQDVVSFIENRNDYG